MSLATENANLVWQKAKLYLMSGNPASQNALAELKKYLAQQKKNPNLQLLPVDGVYSSSDGGNNASQILLDAGSTVYAIFLKKIGTVETIFKGSANATTAGTDGTQKFALNATAAGDVFAVWPDGVAVASGLTVTENTTRTGSTLTLQANQMSGFVIVGA